MVKTKRHNSEFYGKYNNLKIKKRSTDARPVLNYEFITQHLALTISHCKSLNRFEIHA